MITNAFSAGFGPNTQRALLLPVGSSDRVTKYKIFQCRLLILVSAAYPDGSAVVGADRLDGVGLQITSRISASYSRNGTVLLPGTTPDVDDRRVASARGRGAGSRGVAADGDQLAQGQGLRLPLRGWLQASVHCGGDKAALGGAAVRSVSLTRLTGVP